MKPHPRTRYGAYCRFPVPVQPPEVTAWRGFLAVMAGMALGALFVVAFWP